MLNPVLIFVVGFAVVLDEIITFHLDATQLTH